MQKQRLLRPSVFFHGESRAQLEQCWYLGEQLHDSGSQSWASSTLDEQRQAKRLVWVQNCSYSCKDQGVPPCLPWDGWPLANMLSHKRWLWSFLLGQGCGKPRVLLLKIHQHLAPSYVHINPTEASISSAILGFERNIIVENLHYWNYNQHISMPHFSANKLVWI